MMQTQVELYNEATNEFRVYWLVDMDHETQSWLVRGRKLAVAWLNSSQDIDLGGFAPLCVSRVFITIPDDADLPPNARKLPLWTQLEGDSMYALNKVCPYIGTV
jgi:hypothetical protein